VRLSWCAALAFTVEPALAAGDVEPRHWLLVLASSASFVAALCIGLLVVMWMMRRLI